MTSDNCPFSRPDFRLKRPQEATEMARRLFGAENHAPLCGAYA